MKAVVRGALVLGLSAGVAAGLAAQLDAGIPVGSKAPVVTMGDLDGRPVDLGRYLGKQPVLIEFWATWCSVCRSLLPQLRAVAKAYGDRVTMIGINITVNDSRAKVRRYLERHRPPFLALFDEQGTSVRAYEAPITSFIVVVDGAGTVVYTGSGEEQDLVAAVGKAFGR
jgi:thiol-disulfide isomerase/thioredoxin